VSVTLRHTATHQNTTSRTSPPPRRTFKPLDYSARYRVFVCMYSYVCMYVCTCACMYVSRSHNATIVGVQVVNCFGPDSSCSSGEDLPRTAATCDNGDYGFTTHSALLLTTSIASVAAIVSVTDISSCHHHHHHMLGFLHSQLSQLTQTRSSASAS